MNRNDLVNAIMDANALFKSNSMMATNAQKSLAESYAATRAARRAAAVEEALEFLKTTDFEYNCRMQALKGKTMTTFYSWARDDAVKFGNYYLSDLVRGTDLIDQFDQWLATQFTRDDETPFFKTYFVTRRTDKLYYNLNVSWDPSYWASIDEKRAKHSSRGRPSTRKTSKPTIAPTAPTTTSTAGEAEGEFDMLDF